MIVDGNARMRERPIGELVGLLRRLGVEVEELGRSGCVPLRVRPGVPAGGRLDVPTTLSSQFVSALLLLGPWLERGIEIFLSGIEDDPRYGSW